MWSVRPFATGAHQPVVQRLLLAAWAGGLASGLSGCYGPMYQPMGPGYPGGPVQSLTPGAPYSPGWNSGAPGNYTFPPGPLGPPVPSTGQPNPTFSPGTSGGGDAPKYNPGGASNGGQTTKQVPPPADPYYPKSDSAQVDRPTGFIPAEPMSPIQQTGGQGGQAEEEADQNLFSRPTPEGN